MWYEHVTGDSLDGLSLAEQRERVDVIARRFRVYNDGRAPRPRELMPPERYARLLIGVDLKV